jgi:hypothetical protein
MEGTLPFEMSHLTDLVRLDLLNKDFFGPITNIFSGMTNLKELMLENNMFTGPIPDTFSDANPLLESLILEGNRFNGTIPISLTQLPLKVLELAGNRITGIIPSEIGNLIRLRKCGLAAILNLSSILKHFGLHFFFCLPYCRDAGSPEQLAYGNDSAIALRDVWSRSSTPWGQCAHW